jgi:hypothetical protein
MRFTLADFASLEGHFGPSASTPLFILLEKIDIPSSSYVWMVLITFSAERTKPIGLCGQAEVTSITVDIDIT